MTFLRSLSAESRDELRSFVREVVREENAVREHADARREWLTTEEAGVLVGATDNAVRCRLRRGWLAGDVAKDGKRLLIRRSAVLDWLDQRAER